MDSPSDTGKKGTARKVNKKKVAEEEEEEEIRCVCGANSSENDNAAWICCDKCGVWQHNVCVGVSVFEDELPDKYYCEQHDPSAHKELLKAIAEGRPIWEERKAEFKRHQAQEEAAKKKGKKGGSRKSDISTNGKASPVPDVKKSTPAKASKRKDRHDSAEVGRLQTPKISEG